MAKPRKLWSQLTQGTRDRYAAQGVTARQYNSGNISQEQRSKAQRKPPPQPKHGRAYTVKAKGKVKPFTKLSPERQRRDINRVKAATGLTDKEARALLIAAARRGETVQTVGNMVGPLNAQQTAGAEKLSTLSSVSRARAFAKLTPAERSEIARDWANRRYGNILYFEPFPDWPYPELDVEAWAAYAEMMAG